MEGGKTYQREDVQQWQSAAQNLAHLLGGIGFNQPIIDMVHARLQHPFLNLWRAIAKDSPPQHEKPQVKHVLSGLLMEMAILVIENDQLKNNPDYDPNEEIADDEDSEYPNITARKPPYRAN